MLMIKIRIQRAKKFIWSHVLTHIWRTEDPVHLSEEGSGSSPAVLRDSVPVIIHGDYSESEGALAHTREGGTGLLTHTHNPKAETTERVCIHNEAFCSYLTTESHRHSLSHTQTCGHTLQYTCFFRAIF